MFNAYSKNIGGSRALIFFMLALLIYWGNIHLVVESTLSADLVAVSLLFDLAIWVPLLYYFLLSRPGLGPRFILRILISSGLIVAIWKMPDTSALAPIKTVYPWIILAIASILAIIGTLRFIRAWRASDVLNGDERVEYLAKAVIQNDSLARIIKSEWLAWYYGSLGWSLRSQPDSKELFSYDRKSGAPGLILFIAVFQIPAVFFSHIIFHHFSPLLAMGLTVSHIYTLFFCIAQAMAMKHRLIALNSERLQIRCGLLFDCSLPIDQIDNIQISRSVDMHEKRPGRIQASLFGNANTRITLKSPMDVDVIAGIKKRCNEIILGLDEPHLFVLEVQNKINQKSDITPKK